MSTSSTISPETEKKRSSPFGGDFRSTNLDLVISTSIALFVPFIAAQLFTFTGHAIFGLILYYLICCILLVKWRKGTWDYAPPQRWPWIVFCLSLLLPLASAYTNLNQFPANNTPLYGVLLTLFIWAPLNAALEQLSWFYIFDSWKNRWTGRASRWIGWVVGFVLLNVFVGTIHVFFWVRFLPVASNAPLAWLTIPTNTLLVVAFLVLYYRSRSMWPVWCIHVLVDAQLVILAHYSILPHL